MEKIVGGQNVKFEFVFTNTGNEMLEITNVRVSCGCTAAGDWTRKVEPGKTGVIPIKLDSNTLDGPVRKTAIVFSNVPRQSRTTLTLTGKVWWPIRVSPRSVFMHVLSDATSNAPAVVRLVSNLDEPVTFSEPVITNKAFTAELQTIQPGKEFQLNIHAVGPFAQDDTKGIVTLKTSSKLMPEVMVTAFALVQDPISVLPTMVALPNGPSANKATYTVSVRNNATNRLVLSDAELNIPGVDVQLKETQPGRFFTIALNFPAGFDLPEDRKVELSVKSNHPKYPLIKVPVIRWLRPVGKR